MMKRRLSKMAVGMCLILMLAMVVGIPTFAAAKVIKLICNDHNPPFTPPGKAMDAYAAKVNKEGAGKVELTVHHGGALLSGEEAYRGVQTGVCDIAHYVVDSREGFILNLIMSLPFMGWPGQHEAGGLYQKLMDSSKAMQAEWEGVTVLSFMMMPPTHVHTAKKPVRTPDDLKGLKIMGAEFMLNAAMEAAGATPVHLDIGDMAPSINTGLIDGIMNHFPVLHVFGALELVKYHTVFGEGGINLTPMFLVMNTKKLNSLPPDVQKLLMDSSPIWHNTFRELDTAHIVLSVKLSQEWGHTFNYLSPEEIKVWYDLVKGPVHDKWIKDAEAKGLPGKEVYKKALDLIEDYKKKKK
jgi:TRAP-type C4-dicarboxylate transport system substrate-binding protein